MGEGIVFGRPVYLDCPYREKEEVKELGAWWDSEKRKWYVPAGLDCRPFLRWSPRIDGTLVIQQSSTNGNSSRMGEGIVFGRPVYLDCPYREKEEVKELGARWDTEKRKWYVVPGDDVRPFHRWSPRIDGRRVALAKPSFHKSEVKQESHSNESCGHNFWLYLDVPYHDIELAKNFGGRWDEESKKWYVPPEYDVTLFARWSDTAAAVAAGDIGRAIRLTNFGYMSAVQRIAVVDSWRRMAGVQERKPQKKRARRGSRDFSRGGMSPHGVKAEKKSYSTKASTSGEARVEEKLEPKSDKPMASFASDEETPLGDAKEAAKMVEPNESFQSCEPSRDNGRDREKCTMKEQERKSDKTSFGVSNDETVEAADSQKKLATVVTPEKKRPRPSIEEEEDGWV